MRIFEEIRTFVILLTKQSCILC